MISKKLTSKKPAGANRTCPFKPAVVISIGIVATLCLVIAIFLLLSHTDANTPLLNESNQEQEDIEKLVADFNQKILSEDGSDFDGSYKLGNDTDLILRFIELECEEQCSNVEALKIDSEPLLLHEDYEVKRGSVMIIIFANAIKPLEVGEHEITFTITTNEERKLIGTKIVIKDEAQTCIENEVWDGNKCIKEQASSSTTPTQHITSGNNKKKINYVYDPSHTYEDYAKAIFGTCPSERDTSIFWEHGDRLAALGIITDGAHPTHPYNSVYGLLDSAWNYWKPHGWEIGATHPVNTKDYLIANLKNISEFGTTWADTNRGLYVNWATLTIYADAEWSGSSMMNVIRNTEETRQKYLTQTPKQLSSEQMEYLSQQVAEATKYLRWINNSYETMCPND